MTPEVRESSWWRRNALALGIAVVLIAATIGAQSVRQWHQLYDDRPSQPVSAALGETLDFAGSAFTVVDVERLRPGGLLPGTVALRVTVDVAAAPGGTLPEGCYVTLAESGGSHGERMWSTSTHAVDILEPEGTVSYCALDAVAPYTLAAPFVVPDDADGTLVLRIQVGDLAPRYAALEIGRLPE